MSLVVTNPGGGPDVTRRNKRGILYITSDETADNSLDIAPEGSIRIDFHPGDSVAHIEKFLNGVWNDTGFRFASSSVSIGRDTILSGSAGFIETNNPSGIVGHIRSVIPHIEFDDQGTGQPQTPFLKAEEVFDVFTGAVSETVSTAIGINLGVSPGRFLEMSIHEVGTIGSSAPVTVSIYLGTDNTGFIKDQRILPANTLVANTTLTINYDNDLGFRAGEQNFMEFTSTTNFSLKTDIGGNPLTKHEAHELKVESLLTENLMLDLDLNLMFDLSLDPVYAIQFP